MKQIAADGPKNLSPTNTEIRDDYMALWEANIARNNAALAQLGLTKIPMGNNKPKETKKPAKKSKQDKDYDNEEEESDEDEDFESDDDDDDEKVSKVTRSKKPKEKKAKATPAASEDPFLRKYFK